MKMSVKELGVFGLVIMCVCLLVWSIPIMIYDGERNVDGQVVDCIGIFDEQPKLPEGWRWEMGGQPLVPSVFIGFPVGFPIVPIVTLLTDSKCPQQDTE